MPLRELGVALPEQEPECLSLLRGPVDLERLPGVLPEPLGRDAIQLCQHRYLAQDLALVLCDGLWRFPECPGCKVDVDVLALVEGPQHAHLIDAVPGLGSARCHPGADAGLDLPVLGLDQHHAWRSRQNRPYAGIAGGGMEETRQTACLDAGCPHVGVEAPVERLLGCLIYGPEVCAYLLPRAATVEDATRLRKLLCERLYSCLICGRVLLAGSDHRKPVLVVEPRGHLA